MQVLDLIVAEIKEVKEDVKAIRNELQGLHAFKYKVIGATAVISIILTFILNFVLRDM